MSGRGARGCVVDGGYVIRSRALLLSVAAEDVLDFVEIGCGNEGAMVWGKEGGKGGGVELMSRKGLCSRFGADLSRDNSSWNFDRVLLAAANKSLTSGHKKESGDALVFSVL